MSLPIRNLQKAVDRMVQGSGGYWRPASAAFNLYEELLALDEATYSVVLANGQLAPVDANEVKRHLVKLFVAATCIATQYNLHLGDALRDLGIEPDLARLNRWDSNDLRRVVLTVKRRVAQVARVVTLYDFEDASVDTPELPRIAEAVPQLLMDVLPAFSSAEDFRQNFESYLDAPRSPRRFAKPFDPGTAPVLQMIRPIQNETMCPFAKRARLWGAPDYDASLSFEENLHRSLPSLRVFIRVARREPLDGYLYGFPVGRGHDLREVKDRVAGLIFFLSRTCNGETPQEVRNKISSGEGWRFSVFGEECFVNVFSPIYSSSHTRFTYSVRDMMFVMLQPETSFHALIPKGEYQVVRDRIRRAFEETFQKYSLEEHEAHRFILPLDSSHPPVRWYEE